jgi:hypothetical protein
VNPVGNVHLPYRLPTSVADLPQFPQSSQLRNQGGIGHVRHISALPAGRKPIRATTVPTIQAALDKWILPEVGHLPCTKRQNTQP